VGSRRDWRRQAGAQQPARLAAPCAEIRPRGARPLARPRAGGGRPGAEATPSCPPRAAGACVLWQAGEHPVASPSPPLSLSLSLCCARGRRVHAQRRNAACNRLRVSVRPRSPVCPIRAAGCSAARSAHRAAGCVQAAPCACAWARACAGASFDDAPRSIPFAMRCVSARTHACTHAQRRRAARGRSGSARGQKCRCRCRARTARTRR